MKDHTKALLTAARSNLLPSLWLSIAIAFGVIAPYAIIREYHGAKPVKEQRVATHVIDYTAADGAATETYTGAGAIAFVGGGTKIKLTGTEDGESGTWYIPTARIEAIDP